MTFWALESVPLLLVVRDPYEVVVVVSPVLGPVTVERTSHQRHFDCEATITEPQAKSAQGRIASKSELFAETSPASSFFEGILA